MTDVTMRLWCNYWEGPNIFFPKSSSPHSGASSLLLNRYLGLFPRSTTADVLSRLLSINPHPTPQKNNYIPKEREISYIVQSCRQSFSGYRVCRCCRYFRFQTPIMQFAHPQCHLLCFFAVLNSSTDAITFVLFSAPFFWRYLGVTYGKHHNRIRRTTAEESLRS
jgi:hypothetical protein